VTGRYGCVSSVVPVRPLTCGFGLIYQRSCVTTENPDTRPTRLWVSSSSFHRGCSLIVDIPGSAQGRWTPGDEGRCFGGRMGKFAGLGRTVYDVNFFLPPVSLSSSLFLNGSVFFPLVSFVCFLTVHVPFLNMVQFPPYDFSCISTRQRQMFVPIR
jgi:hypothetical protein